MNNEFSGTEEQRPPSELPGGGMDRRRFLQTAATGAGAAALPWAGPAAQSLAAAARARRSRDELVELTARKAVAAMRAGELKAKTYVSALLRQASALEHLNALITLDPEQVLAAAHTADKRRAQSGAVGPLHGLPVLIKDNINTTAYPTTGGTPALERSQPPRNAEVVERLLSAGAIPFAKSNLHELAVGITSNNAATGAVRNPYDPTKIPGGSSGGNGAAVAARICPASIGTDTAGSVRVPAALCGIASLRPTVGRYPATGDADKVTDFLTLSHTRDTPGPMARTVADVALLDAVITDDDVRLRPRHLRGVRLGVDRANFFENLDPNTESVISHALRRLQRCGAELIEVEVEDAQSLNAAASLLAIGGFEAGLALPKYLAANNTGISLEQLRAGIASPDARALFSLVGAIPEPVYLDAVQVQRPKLQDAYRQAFERHRLDALVFPTTPLPARPIGQDETVELNGQQVPTFFTYIRNTDPGAGAGLPGMNIPAGLTPAGVPVGLELDGPAGSDRALLTLGLAIEKELGVLPGPTP
jgi:Asp-tRNA(Asn)/Glu-tRNA(Gln) amidotransferase A subunit family amidase